MTERHPEILGAMNGTPEEFAQDQPAEEYEFSPEQQDMIDNYVLNAIKIVHSPQSSDAIIESLKSINVPQAAIAKTANLVHDMIAMEAERSGKDFNAIALMMGSTEMIDELIELGEQARAFPPLSEAQRYAAHQLAMQHYFGRGIKEGWIDPVKLQQDVEPLMPEEMRQRGRAVMQEVSQPMGRSQERQLLPGGEDAGVEGILR